MEIKGEPVYFENMSEVEVFEVLSNCLKSELNNILKNYQNLPQDNGEEANERKDLLNFLMTTKDRDELNKFNVRFVSNLNILQIFMGIEIKDPVVLLDNLFKYQAENKMLYPLNRGYFTTLFSSF